MDWKYYLETLGSWVGKKPRGSIPFFMAWNLGRVMEMTLTPLGIRPPMTRLAASVMGKNNDVDNSRARTELGWESRVDQDTAMAEIEQWAKGNYLST